MSYAVKDLVIRDLAPAGAPAIANLIAVALRDGRVARWLQPDTAARHRGNRTIDGLGMLLHQAVPAFARWFGTTPQVTPDLRALLEADIRRKP